MYTLIIVDYNSLEATIDFVRHYKSHLGHDKESHVVIVQNGTPEQEWETLTSAFGVGVELAYSKKEYKLFGYEYDNLQIRYCHTGENLGYAKGNNVGAQIAQITWHDPYYIISNNDVVFEKSIDYIAIAKIFEANSKIGAIGPKVLSPTAHFENPRRWQSASQRLILNYWTSTFHHLIGKWFHGRKYLERANDKVSNAKSGPCDWISGCFMILRASAFHDVDMFDRKTFLYAEEMILSKRMQHKGYYVFYWNEAEVLHNHAQTTKNFLSSMRISKLDFEANCYFYQTYMGTSKLLIKIAKISYGIYSMLLRMKNKYKKL